MKKTNVIAAVVMASVIAFAAHVTADRQKAALPVASWFQVDEFFVADTAWGDAPVVSARFLVLDDSEAFWVSEVERLVADTQWQIACSSSGVLSLTTAQSLETGWRGLTEPSCALAPGQYRLRVTFVLVRPGWQPKRLPVTSNTFTVGARDG